MARAAVLGGMTLLKQFSVLLLATACAGGPQPEGPGPEDGLVGGIHPPVPAGYEERSSLLLDSGLAPRHALFEWRRNNAPVISLARSTTDSVPLWRTLNVLRLPVIGSGDALVLGACRTADGPDRRVVAVVQRGAGDSLRIIRYAWRADTALARFERISGRGVVCENEAAAA